MPHIAFGEIEERGDTDWFRVRFEEGKTYTITASDDSLVLGLALPDGTVIAPPVAYTNQITFVAAVTGDYWVSATGTGQPTFYSITAAEEYAPNPASTSTNLTLDVGETATGTSYAPDDWYAVDLVAGQSYFFSAELTARLYLSDAAGNLVTLDDHQLHFTPTQSGTYYAGINFSGAYHLTLEEVADDHGASAASAGTLSIGAATAGVWEAGDDSDWYAITLEAGSSYSFSLSASTPGITSRPLQIYDASGQLVAEDASGSALPATFMFSAATNGTYYVAATRGSDYYNPHGDGNYSLTAQLVPGELAGNVLTTGTITIGSTVNGTWQASGDSDWYAVSLTAGQAYSFALSSSVGSVDLALYDSSGNQLSISFNGAFDNFGAVGFTAQATGTYYVGASSQHVGSATYSVTATTYTDDFASSSLTTGTATVDGAAVGGTIQAQGDSDWFAVQLIAGRSYVFDSDVATLVMRDAQGNALTAVGWGDRHYTPTVSGTYYVEALGSQGDSYSFTIGQVTDDYRQDTLSTGVMRTQTTGTAASDIFVSTVDHDFFSGQGGDDRFVAGDGYDQYFGGAGTDTVSFAGFTAGVTVRLWQGGLFENGALRIQIGSMENVEGTAFGDAIEGNSVANVISAGDGADALAGLSGNDTLDGGTGNDILLGGSGADSMLGGEGADVYEVDDAGDVVFEHTDQGTDDVFAYANFTLPDHVENLFMNYGSQTYGYGNGLGNTIIGNGQANVIEGRGGADIIDGGLGGDHLDGGSGNDTITGGDGADVLLGGTGIDTMIGGVGSDIYEVDDAADVIVELAGQGTADNIFAYVDYSLPDHSENLLMNYGLQTHGYGNTGDNIIVGNGQANVIEGRGGYDTITGGAGSDLFIVNPGFGVDVITDFVAGAGTQDAVMFSQSLFSNFDQVMANSAQVGADTWIGDGFGNTIVLVGVQRTSLHADDFGFFAPPSAEPLSTKANSADRWSGSDAATPPIETAWQIHHAYDIALV
ncbi:MAG: pre-peptidase C-terminal domain-containing protein [Pseudomonadota bacterium]|nr:pre-peptidase C-terminal domain-containing protein [Pseudomonadota bacterium]